MERRKSLPLFPNFRRLRPPGPFAIGEAAHAGEHVARDAGGRVLFRVDLERRLAAIAKDRIAALHILDKALDGLRIKQHLLGPLRNSDRLFSPLTVEKNVIGESGLHEFAGHLRTGMLRAINLTPGPERAREIAELFDFSGHQREDCTQRRARLRRAEPDRSSAARPYTSMSRNTRRKFPPRIFSTSVSDRPRSSSRAVTSGNPDAVCSSSGSAGTPSKSLPIPT